MAQDASLPMTPTRPPSSTGGDYRDDDAQFCVVDVPSNSIYASISRLLLNGQYSDMIIRCGGNDFRAHRAIVCPQSSFFDKALSGPFAEASSGIVELEDDPEIVKLFLQFLYTGNYDNGITPTNGLPSVPAMMTPEEVSEELSVSPGVFIPENINERGEVGQRAAEPDDDKDATENGEDDGDYGEAFDYELEEGEEDPSPSDAPEEYAEFGQLENVENLKADTTTKPLPTSGPEAEAIVHAEFLVPLRLYVMADRFDVPALKLLARDRFYRAAESRWEALLDFFPKVIAEIYRTTSPADTAIREIVCRLVGARIRDEHIREALRPVMCEFGEFAVGVMEYSLYFLKLVE